MQNTSCILDYSSIEKDGRNEFNSYYEESIITLPFIMVAVQSFTMLRLRNLILILLRIMISPRTR